MALPRGLCGERVTGFSFSPHSHVGLDSRWPRSQLSIFWVLGSFGSSCLTPLACLSLSIFTLCISLRIASPELIIDDVLSIEATRTGCAPYPSMGVCASSDESPLASSSDN